MAIDKKTISDLKFTGWGCALCFASADLAIETIKGKTINEAVEIIDHFHQVMLGKTELNSNFSRLKVIEGVKKYPKLKAIRNAGDAF